MRSVIPTRSSRTPSGWQTAALLGAAGLAASLLYVQAKKRSTERENPPQGKFVEVDGVRLHYLERGTGPTLVLLHGNGVFANDFELSGLLDNAATPYRVIAFDRPGFGYSERPASTVWTPEEQARLLYKALHQLGIERPIVVGHSWGTLVALSMALDYPDDVRALVLLSGYYYPSLRLDAPMSSPPAIPVIGDLLRFTLAPLIGRLIWPALVKRIFSPAPVPDSFRELPVWMMLRPSQLRASAAESALMVPSALVLSRRYAELKMPVMIVAGNDDKVASSGHNAGRLHDALPQSSLRLAPNQGHMLHYADPDDIVCGIDAMQALPQPSLNEQVLSRA